MNAKAEQWERTHTAILDAAERLLRARGLDAPTVAEVMGAAGLTVGGFYAHFDDKEALFDAAMQRAIAGLFERYTALVRGDNGRQRVISVLRAYLSRRHRDTPAAGCALPATVPDVAAAQAAEAPGARLRPTLVAFVQEIARVLHAIGEGEVSRGTTLALIALMYGAISLSRALAGTALSDEILLACRRFVAAALDGGATADEVA